MYTAFPSKTMLCILGSLKDVRSKDILCILSSLVRLCYVYWVP